MRIHYISCHQVLEWSEVSLLIELGHEVFANGAYINGWHSGLIRPEIPGQTLFPELAEISSRFPRTELPKELIDPFDLIIVMGGITDNVLISNWERIKHKKVIWRSIGQSLSSVERSMTQLRRDGLKIVRYSPMEEHITEYAGADAMIRFYADPEDLGEWNGSSKQVINITQSLKGRRYHTHYDPITEVMNGFEGKVFGTGNEDLGTLNGGELPYSLLKGQLRDNRVFIYGGTYPAPYTLSFIDAWMTGIPIVSIGKKLAGAVPGAEEVDFFEIPHLITHGEDGFFADDITELKGYVKQLLDNYELSSNISKRSRSKASSIFGKEVIKNQWNEYINSL